MLHLSLWVLMCTLQSRDTAVNGVWVMDTAVNGVWVQALTMCASKAADQGYLVVLVLIPIVPAW